jgi:hypothetical protein
LLLIGCGVLLFLGIAAFVMKMLRSSEACETAFQAVQQSEIVRREVGMPMTLGWFITGRMNDFNGNGTARLNLPVTGPKGQVSVEVDARGKQGHWTYSKMTATLRATGQEIDLLPLLPEHSRALPSSGGEPSP